MKTKRKPKKRHGKLRKSMAMLLCLCFLLSASACGEKRKTEGKRIDSIFDFFNVEIEPSTSTTDNTEEHTGDVIVDPPAIDPPAVDDNKYADTENEELNKLFDEYFKESVTGSTITFRDYIKDPANFGLEELAEVTWGDEETTKESLEESKKDLEKWISRLEAIDVNTLTEQQRFDYDYMLDNLKGQLVTYENIYIGSAFAPMRGLQGNLPTVFTDFIFREKKDFDTYIELMEKIPAVIDDSLQFEQLRVDEGYGYEDCVIDEIINQCDEFTEVTGEHFMITTFNDTVDAFAGLTDTEKADLKKRNKEALNNAMIPAYRKIKKSFEGWKGKCKVKGGMCNFEDHGSEIYEYLVREYTGSSKDPQEMMAYLEEKEQKLKQEMLTVYSLYPDAYSYYAQNSETMFDYLSDKSVEEIVALIMDKSMEDFPKIDEIKYKASYLDKSLEEIRSSTSAYYMIPAIDDPDGNLIRVNGAHLNGLWTTLAHEGCPGHMYQTNYYRRTDPNHIRELGTELGYMEGWAVYSSYESVKHCDFNGASNPEALAALSRIEECIGYGYHGQVDIGVNALGWTVEDVRSLLVKKGISGDNAEKLYRIVVGDPGVYLSYSVGYYEMQDLRDYAEQELGSKFKAVEFHEAVLNAGPCKYDQLKKKIDKYILEHK